MSNTQNQKSDSPQADKKPELAQKDGKPSTDANKPTDQKDEKSSAPQGGKPSEHKTEEKKTGTN